MNESRKWLTHSYRVQVLEAQVDFYGHMTNLAYLAAFEAARWQMITKRGYGLSEIHRFQAGPVVLGIEVKFLKETLLRQNVVIQTFGLDYERKVGTLRQQLVSESGETHCVADFKMGLFDLKQRKLILPTPEWRKASGELEP